MGLAWQSGQLTATRQLVSLARATALSLLGWAGSAAAASDPGSLAAFESGQVRPLVLAPAENQLFALNTPDNRVERYAVSEGGLVHQGSIPVGLEPVAMALRGTSELWVVNHLSDSISIIDLSGTPARVVRTLWVGNEPRDIVFAGANRERAFITTAHRGQNSPWIDARNPGQLTTPGIGRADVWVFDAAALGSNAPGTALTVLTLFTDTPRALAATPDGRTVYAAGFHTGNRSTVLSPLVVCRGGASAAPCRVDSRGTAPGGLPAPNADAAGVAAPHAGMIVQYRGGH